MERHIWNALSMSRKYGAKMLGSFWNGDKTKNIILLKLIYENLLEKDFSFAMISATYDTSLATYVSLSCIA